jgi:catechol 2,3-dioxygenase-like lactoylglutathione lyase family enzyme
MKTGAINHLVLTVSDIERSKAFYTDVLGFKVIGENPAAKRVAISNGDVVLALSLPPDPSQAPQNDAFSEHRIGLDHLNFTVGHYDALVAAQRELKEQNVPHGEIKDLSANGFPIYVMAFRDPDNIQLELSAPVGN